MTQHLDSDLLAAYGERRLNQAERAQAESHLAECVDCRGDLAGVAAVLGAARRRRRVVRTTPLLAAAALLAIVVVTDPFSRTVGPEPLRPGGEAEGLAVLVAISPEAGARVQRAGLRFLWGSDGPDARYELRLADASGLLIWQQATSDTTLVPPDSLRLEAGVGYLWWVDVLLPDGRLARTPLREFILGP